MHVSDARRLLVALACALALAPAGTAEAKPPGQCENGSLRPARGNLGAVRAAVLCLHNRERGARGMPLLQESGRLRRAAKGHSEDMVQRRFFAHDSPAGASMTDRIRHTGYGDDRSWALGENIGWGGGELATAAEILRAWMHSPDHKANILRRAYRDVGIGIALGGPVDASDGATYTADFGVTR